MLRITYRMMYKFHPGVFALCFMVNCPRRGLNPSQMWPPKGGVVSLYWVGDFSRWRLTGVTCGLLGDNRQAGDNWHTKNTGGPLPQVSHKEKNASDMTFFGESQITFDILNGGVVNSDWSSLSSYDKISKNNLSKIENSLH